MRIIVPEDLSNELRLLPEGPCRATLDRIIYGTSKMGFPKLTLRWICLSELFDGEKDTSIGEPIIDQYSLQPQAMWRINKVYRQFTGKDLTHGDYSPEEFIEMLESELKGVEATLIIEHEITPEGREVNRVAEVKA